MANIRVNTPVAGPTRFVAAVFVPHGPGAVPVTTAGLTVEGVPETSKAGWDAMFAPQVPGFLKATLNDLASVEALITEKTVAVMLEPVQGEGGVIPASKEFMQGLRALGVLEINALQDLHPAAGR